MQQPAHRPAHGRAGLPGDVIDDDEGSSHSGDVARRDASGVCGRARAARQRHRGAGARRRVHREGGRRDGAAIQRRRIGAAARHAPAPRRQPGDVDARFPARRRLPRSAVGGDAVGRARRFPRCTNTAGRSSRRSSASRRTLGLDRWTFAVGVYGPSSVGNRTYPLSVGGVPSPARYDLVQALPLVVFPTAAAAVRATRWLDIGIALHVAVAKFDLTSVSFTDISKGVCPNPEYQPCDSTNKLDDDRRDGDGVARRARASAALVGHRRQRARAGLPQHLGHRRGDRAVGAADDDRCRRRPRSRRTCRGWCASARAS